MIPLDPSLAALRRALPVALRGKDPEGVHRLRSTTRRLSSWLALAGRRALEDDLRWLRSSAGMVRDLDVLLATAPPRRFAAWLAERRVAARAQLVTTLRSPRTAGLLTALSLLPPLSRKRARRRVARLSRNTLARSRAFAAAPTDLAALHSLRKAARKLRYAQEWLGKKPRALVRAQDALGAVNDVSLALGFLDGWEGRGTLPGYRRRLLTQLDRKAARAAAVWTDTRAQLEEKLDRWSSTW